MRRHTVLALLAGLLLATSASATMVHQDWDQSVSGSRQAIIDFLGDLVNPASAPDLEEIIDETLYRGSKDNYVAKFYGWVTVPETGTYQFHYACDDFGMLYVSQDEEMVNAVEVAYVDGWCANAEWDKYPTQHSDPMQLRAGQTMAVMAFFQEAGGGDNMDLGWTGPGLSNDITNPTYLTDYITHIPPTPTKAKNPNPEVGAVDVPRDTDMSWTAGKFAATHDVYLGASYADVNDASRADPMGVLVSQGQAAATYDPGYLDWGQTYYWRVDEVNAVPTTIFKGKIWEFTVEPFAYPVEGVIATTNAVSEEGAGIENALNGSGLNAAGEHSVEALDMWLTLPGGADPIQIEFEFPQVYKLDEMRVWNYNVQFEMMLGFGVKDVTVEYSADGAEWTVLGDVEFAQGTSMPGYTANTAVDFGGVPVKYVRLTINSGWGPLGQFGLSEVQFMQIPAHAREPQPADDAADVSVDTMLAWRAGREAVSHEVYFGTDPNALALADTVDTASYTPGTLDLDTAYYWQIIEVNEADEVSAWPGSVWSFTSQEFLVVDDFESYTDDEGSRIYESWADGWVNDTGSTVGYLEGPFAETTIVNSGSQSMPLFYDNAGVATSEADFELSQNWTASGIKSLSLYFHGDPENSGGQLYLKINNTKVAYDGDAADITRAAWQAWNIDLSTVGNVSNVASLTIGVEGASAAGVLYIDDVRLYPLAPEYIVPVEPDSAGLVALYKLDGNADDSSGNGNNGTLNGDVQFGAGVDGSALDCDGVDDYVSTGKSASDLGIGGNSPRTVTVWVYTRSFANGGIYDVGARTATQDFCLRTMDTQDTWRIQYWGGDFDFTYDTTDKWVHFAHVHDGTHTKIYANGVLIVDWAKTIDTTDTNPFQIGCYGWQNDYFDGLIDDLHLYNRALSAGEVLGAAGQTTPRHKPF